MKLRLYSPDLNTFVNPTDRDVFIWFKEDRIDKAIGHLQTYMITEVVQEASSGKYWDPEKKKIRYTYKKSRKKAGRWPLYPIQYSHLNDKDDRPIFHGDLLRAPMLGSYASYVCVADCAASKFINLNNSTEELSYLDVCEYKIIGSAILEPHLVSESLRPYFIYPNPML